MGIHVLATFTCDRCGVTATSEMNAPFPPPPPPEGWKQVIVPGMPAAMYYYGPECVPHVEQLLKGSNGSD